MIIFIGSDHAGYLLKESMKEFLSRENHEIKDIGPFNLEPGDDFPDYSKKLCHEILTTLDSKGILICGSGQGMAISANRFKGIRAALCWSQESAKQAGKHLDSNVLCLGADFISEKKAFKIIDTWLKTPFLNKEKYIRRIEKI